MEATPACFEGAGDHAVGRHHELLNQRGGAVLFEARDVDGLIGQHHGPGFNGLKIERAMLEAAAHHALGGRVLKLELRGQIGAGGNLGRRGAVALKPCAHAVIGQLRAVAHQRAVGLAIGSRAGRVHGILDHHAPRGLDSRSAR